MSAPSIRRNFHGGYEDVAFAHFAHYVVQDQDVATHVARRLLAGDDPYPWNEGDCAFYETFVVIDRAALEAQLEAARR